MNKQVQGNIMLLMTALIWGTAFVAQRAGMDLIGPYTFNGIRSLIGALVLVPVVLIFSKSKTDAAADDTATPEEAEAEKKSQRKTLLIGGLASGAVLFIASSLQQIGLVYTTAGKTGFITALYVVLVPLFGLFVGRKVRIPVWIGVVLAIGGLYLLCITDDFSISKGDLYVLFCAFGFAAHILTIDHFSPKTDGIKLSCVQFFVCGLISIVPMFVFEQPNLTNILACWLPLLYAGVLSCGVAYTFQIVAQKYTDPTITSILLSLESVFAVIFGAIILSEQLLTKEIVGCVLMFAAVIIAQLPERKQL